MPSTQACSASTRCSGDSSGNAAPNQRVSRASSRNRRGQEARPEAARPEPLLLSCSSAVKSSNSDIEVEIEKLIKQILFSRGGKATSERAKERRAKRQSDRARARHASERAASADHPEARR